MFGENHDFRPKESNDGLFDFDMPSSWKSGLGQGEWKFSRGVSRKLIKTIYNPESEYVLFKVTINHEADKLLRKYVGDFKWIDGKVGDSNYRKAKTKREKEYSFRFNHQLLEGYVESLSNLTKQHFGENSFVSFSIVEGNRWGVWGSQNWPRVYVITDKGDTSKDFRNLAGKLNDVKSYNFLKKREYPQNYHIAEINLLRNKKILPLIVQSNEWRVNSENLRNAINFLVPFTLEHDSHEGLDGDL